MNDEHLTEELLSAHLDGEAPEAAEHLTECGACRARLAELQAAAALVAEPPPVMDDRARAVALAAAMDAWQEGDTRETGPSRGRPWLLAAAAVAVGLVVSVAVLRDNDHDRQSTAANNAAGRVTATAALDGGDLGDQSDPSTLAGVVRSALGGSAEAAVSQDGAVSGGSGAGGSTAGGAVTADRAAPFGATGQASTQRPASASATTTTAARAPGPGAVRRSCIPTVNQDYGAGLGPLAYTATLRWQGAPAELLAYRLAQPGKNLTIRVFVMAQADCRLLVVQAL